MDDLFRLRGRYTYWNGVNPRAVIALGLAIAPVIPGFIRAVSTPGGTVANANVFDRIYSYAWFFTFVWSFIYYWLMMRGQRVTQPATKS